MRTVAGATASLRPANHAESTKPNATMDIRYAIVAGCEELKSAVSIILHHSRNFV
jgi:hypothetical protein